MMNRTSAGDVAGEAGEREAEAGREGESGARVGARVGAAGESVGALGVGAEPIPDQPAEEQGGELRGVAAATRPPHPGPQGAAAVVPAVAEELAEVRGDEAGEGGGEGGDGAAVRERGRELRVVRHERKGC